MVEPASTAQSAKIPVEYRIFRKHPKLLPPDMPPTLGDYLQRGCKADRCVPQHLAGLSACA